MASRMGSGDQHRNCGVQGHLATPANPGPYSATHTTAASRHQEAQVCSAEDTPCVLDLAHQSQ